MSSSPGTLQYVANVLERTEELLESDLIFGSDVMGGEELAKDGAHLQKLITTYARRLNAEAARQRRKSH